MSSSTVAYIHGGQDAVDLNITYTEEIVERWLSEILVEANKHNDSSVQKKIKVGESRFIHMKREAEVIFYFYYLSGGTMKIADNKKIYMSSIYNENYETKELTNENEIVIVNKLKIGDNKSTYIVEIGDIRVATGRVFSYYALKGKVAVRGLLRRLFLMFDEELDVFLIRIQANLKLHPTLADKARVIAKKDGLKFIYNNDAKFCSDVLPVNILPDNVRSIMDGLVVPEGNK